MLELPELLADLHVVAAKWYNIGLNLVPHVTRGNLNNIRASCRDEPCDCLREMLSCWLNKVHPKPRWESVVAALRCPVVDEEQLAQTLEQKYYTVACKSHLPSFSPFPLSSLILFFLPLLYSLSNSPLPPFFLTPSTPPNSFLLDI